MAQCFIPEAYDLINFCLYTALGGGGVHSLTQCHPQGGGWEKLTTLPIKTSESSDKTRKAVYQWVP